MKYKILSIAALALIIYSCKSSSGTTAANETRPAATPAPATASAGPSVMTPELAEGKSLYDNNCAKCHRLFSPNEFSAEDWKPIVAKMQKKAHLDDLQGQKIYNYLTMK